MVKRRISWTHEVLIEINFTYFILDCVKELESYCNTILINAIFKKWSWLKFILSKLKILIFKLICYRDLSSFTVELLIVLLCLVFLLFKINSQTFLICQDHTEIFYNSGLKKIRNHPSYTKYFDKQKQFETEIKVWFPMQKVCTNQLLLRCKWALIESNELF